MAGKRSIVKERVQETGGYAKSPADGKAVVPSFPAYYSVAPAYAEADEIDLVALWRTLVGHKWLILLATLLVTGLATTAAVLSSPVYRADVLLAPVSPERETVKLARVADQFGGLAALAGIKVENPAPDIEAAIATLESRQFTLAFISDNNLLPVLFEEKWDSAKKTWAVEASAEPPTQWDAYRLFDQEIRSILRDKKTGFVTLNIEWKDRHQAAQWANELVVRINRHEQAKAIKEAQRSIAFLQEQLAETSVYEIQQAIHRLIEAQRKTIMLANARDEFVFEVIDKAVPPDADDFAKPKRTLMIALGVVAGLMFGVFLALFLSFVDKQKAKARELGDGP